MNEEWKNNPIYKKDDGTFLINSGQYPYHVCSTEVDPDGTYDIAEVSAFWDSLPDDDPRKQIYVDPPAPVDTRTAERKREDAYVIEADPLFRQYEYYSAEAAAADLLDDEDAAEAAREKAQDFLIAYYQKKLEIRAMYPDEDDGDAEV